jgi:hypothetical protein
VYEAVDIMKKQGDFYVALPRFRLGGKPDVWAKKVVDEVSSRGVLRCKVATRGVMGER